MRERSHRRAGHERSPCREAPTSVGWVVSSRRSTEFCQRAVGRGDWSMPEITWDDFAKVDIRVGRIVEVEDFPKARKPAYKLRIDFGELGTRSSSAQITKYYDKADLVGKLVLAVVNFPPRQIANFFSEVLTLGVVLGDGDIVLVHPERDVLLENLQEFSDDQVALERQFELAIHIHGGLGLLERPGERDADVGVLRLPGTVHDAPHDGHAQRLHA